MLQQNAESNKKELCEAPENSPASWCKKSELKGAEVPPADFLLEAEKRGSPPKSEKAAAFWRVGGAGRGVQPFCEKESSENSGKRFTESIKESQGGLLRRFCESARNDEILDSSLRKCSAQNDNVILDSANSQNLFFKALILSLLAHLIVLLGVYFLSQNISFLHENQMQKVKLSFKRGGDSKMENSPHKINSSIPRNLPDSADSALDSAITSATLAQAQNLINPQNLAQTSPKNNSSLRDLQVANRGNPPIKNATNSAESSSKNPTDSAPNALNLASLQVYNNANLNPNLAEQKRKEIINYIASKAIPSDIKAEIFELYGDELGDYGLAEIDFIVNNLRDIGRITQYHINRRGYPQSARLLNQQGKNVIEFYLHPNGDISELRVVSSANSMILDNDMMTNIKIAFREYPRPTSKVKIRFYMTYRLL